MAAKTNFKYCPYCSAELPVEGINRSKQCAKCGKAISPAGGVQSYEYKSSLRLFGWPLLHINTGKNPETGRPGVAKGLLAIGDIAVGGIAMGGVAVGGLALGGLAIGLVTLAGCSIGLLFAVGGLAIGLGLSMGGCAIGSIALGGLAIGIYSLGGMALGLHTLGGNGGDIEASQFFKTWRTQLGLLAGQIGPFIAFAILTPMLSVPFIRRTNEEEPDENWDKKNLTDDRPRESRSLVGLLICLILGGAVGVGALWLIAILIVSF